MTPDLFVLVVSSVAAPALLAVIAFRWVGVKLTRMERESEVLRERLLDLERKMYPPHDHHGISPGRTNPVFSPSVAAELPTIPEARAVRVGGRRVDPRRW